VKRSNLVLLLGVAVFAFSANAQAEGLDGSEPLVCDLIEAAQCDGVANCTDVTVEQIGLPPVWHVDFAGSQIASAGAQRTSPIAAVEVLDAVLVLQGHQRGHGWTMVIERATGHLSAALAGAEGAFVLAGACTAR
jgi:hypothetical protein